jgi:hypothetical protein
MNIIKSLFGNAAARYRVPVILDIYVSKNALPECVTFREPSDAVICVSRAGNVFDAAHLGIHVLQVEFLHGQDAERIIKTAAGAMRTLLEERIAEQFKTLDVYVAVRRGDAVQEEEVAV